MPSIDSFNRLSRCAGTLKKPGVTELSKWQTAPQKSALFFSNKKWKKMTLAKIEMTPAKGKTFMRTANAVDANMQSKTQARHRQNALKTVRFAECGLFA